MKVGYLENPIFSDDIISFKIPQNHMIVMQNLHNKYRYHESIQYVGDDHPGFFLWNVLFRLDITLKGGTITILNYH